jgi:hypothetical protein
MGTYQGASSPVSDVFRYDIITQFSTYFRHSYVGGKHIHTWLILLSLDGSGYVWLMYMHYVYSIIKLY